MTPTFGDGVRDGLVLAVVCGTAAFWLVQAIAAALVRRRRRAAGDERVRRAFRTITDKYLDARRVERRGLDMPLADVRRQFLAHHLVDAGIEMREVKG